VVKHYFHNNEYEFPKYVLWVCWSGLSVLWSNVKFNLNRFRIVECFEMFLLITKLFLLINCF
jgi:hypothetical protein